MPNKNLRRTFHHSDRLATPGAKLVLRLECGKEIIGSRPGHIVKARGDQPNYIDSEGRAVRPVAWAYY